MAENINRINECLNQLFENGHINREIISKIAEKDYYREVQLSNDYKLIAQRITKALNEMNSGNIFEKSLEIEAILRIVLQQFEVRKNEASEAIRNLRRN